MTEKDEIMVYPDGSGRVGKKFAPDGMDALRCVESMRVKMEGGDIILFPEQVFFDGSALGKVLKRIESHNTRLAVKVEKLEHELAKLKKQGGH